MVKQNKINIPIKNNFKIKCTCEKKKIICSCFIREYKILKELTFQTKDDNDIIYNIIYDKKNNIPILDGISVNNKFSKNFFKQLNKNQLSSFVFVPRYFNNIKNIFDEVKFILEKCELILESNSAEIQSYFDKMYTYSLLPERKHDVIDGHLFEKQYNFRWVGIEEWYNNMSIFSYLNEHFFYLIELLEKVNILFLVDLSFRNEVKQLLYNKKIIIIKILLVILKEYYLKDIVNYGSIYINNFILEELWVNNFFNFIFKLDIFTKEEILVIDYILNDLKYWSYYRNIFINCEYHKNDFNFSRQLLEKGTENMRINISKNLSIIPLEYFKPFIDIYTVFKKILKNKEWRIHPMMLNKVGFSCNPCNKHYFNYNEVDVMEKIVQFYWEEFIKNLKIDDKKKLEKKYWYIDYWSNFSNFETINKDFKKYYLNKRDYIVGEEWDEETKDWKNFSDSISDEIIRGIKYWGWEEYRSRRGMEFSFEEYVGMNNLNITWEDVSKNA